MASAKEMLGSTQTTKVKFEDLPGTATGRARAAGSSPKRMVENFIVVVEEGVSIEFAVRIQMIRFDWSFELFYISIMRSVLNWAMIGRLVLYGVAMQFGSALTRLLYAGRVGPIRWVYTKATVDMRLLAQVAASW